MAKITCQTCNGSKTVEGMGYMRHKCPACGGTGFVDNVNASAEAETARAEEIKIKKKPGRKPKNADISRNAG